jgi:hypothetical protein
MMSRTPTLELFHKHFSLYHALYRLEEALRETSYSLLIKNIRIYLLTRPGPGYCRYLDELRNDFCRASCSDGESLCDYHENMERRLREHGTIDYQHIRNFYLDPSNRDTVDEKMLNSMTQYIYQYLNSFHEIEEYLDLFGLDADYSRQRLKTRYRYLSKKYHPDAENGSETMFKKITNGYHLLRKIKNDL